VIEFIRGQIAFVETDYVVLDVQGIGYQVYCGNPYRFSIGSEQTLHTHHHTREDVNLLFGFIERSELMLFRQLLEVSGIGPKVAMGILTGGSPTDVWLAIQQENLQFLTKLPGIGKKTAQRMILDLKDRTKGMFEALGELSTNGNATFAIGGSPWQENTTSAWNETKEALRSLGYSEQEIVRAIDVLIPQMSDDTAVDERIKRALQVLFQGGR
jgi:Holliday junction DNA helicase RuvA